MFPTLNLLHEFLFSHKVFQGLIKVFFFFYLGNLTHLNPRHLGFLHLSRLWLLIGGNTRAGWTQGGVWLQLLWHSVDSSPTSNRLTAERELAVLGSLLVT